MRTTLVLSACLLLGPPSVFGEEESRFRPEACFPDGVLYGSIANGSRLRQRLASTLPGRMVTHPGFRKAFAGFVAFLKERMGSEADALSSLTGKSPLEVLGLIQGEAALHIGISGDGSPAFAIALELGKTKAEILEVRGRLKALAEQATGSPLETAMIEGSEATLWPGPAGPVLDGVLGTHLVLASGQDLFTAIAAAHKARKEPVDREKALDPDLARDLIVNDRESLLLVNLQALREILLENVPGSERQDVDKVLHVSGLDRVTSFGAALGFRDGGAETVWRLGMREGAGGILGVLARSLPELGELQDALGLIPAGVDELQAGRIDVGRLLGGVDGVVREAFPELGGQLDSVYGEVERVLGVSIKGDLFRLGEITAHSFSISPPAGALFSDDVVLVRTESLEPYWKLLEKIGAAFGARPRALGATGGVTYFNLTDGKLVEGLRATIAGSGDLGGWTPSAPEAVLLLASAGFARADAGDGWTAVSPLPQAILRHVEIHSKGPRLGGADGAGLASLLRREAKGASAVMVSRGGRSILAVYNSLLPLANAFYPILKAVGIDPAELPPGEAFLADVKPGYLRLAVDAKGFTIRGHRALETRAGVLAGVSFAAMGAGFLVPVLARGRGEAYTVQCGSNLKQLFGRALAYSDESGTFPYSQDGSLASLQALIDFEPQGIEPRMFFCHSHGGREPIKEGGKVVLAADTVCYEVVPWRLKNTALNAIWMYDREPVHRGGRNVVFSDGSVQWMEEGEFQKALAENRERFSKAEAAPKKAAPRKAEKKKAGQ